MADTMTLEQVRSNMRDAMNSVLKDDTRRMVVDWYNAIDAAIKQREHDVKDAARYRWLLGTHDKLCEPIQDMWTEVTHSEREYPTKNEWDSAIDAAMAKESGNE